MQRGHCDGAGLGGGWVLAGVAIRVAVIVPCASEPVTTTVVPTGKSAAVFGCFGVPKAVCAVTVTVTVLPAVVRTVQVVPASVTMVPRTPWPPPLSGRVEPLDEGVGAAAGVLGVDRPNAAQAIPPSSTPARI